MNTGLLEDIGESPHASVDPEPIRDSLRDILKDAVCSWHGPLPLTESDLKRAFFNLIDTGFRQASEIADADAVAVHERVSEFLFLLKDVLNTRLHIYAVLICMGKIPDSEEEIARELGVTKQAVSKSKINVQKWFWTPCRVGRKDESRSKFCAIAMSRGPRRQKQQWNAQRLFVQR